MTSDQAIRELEAHGSGTEDCSASSFADAVWRWKQGGERPAFQSIAWVIVDLLQTMLSGGAIGEPAVVPRSVAYSIAEVLTRSAEIAVTSDDEAVRRDVARSSWIIACAWEAACAGDVISLSEHVRLEQQARGLLS